MPQEVGWNNRKRSSGRRNDTHYPCKAGTALELVPAYNSAALKFVESAEDEQ